MLFIGDESSAPQVSLRNLRIADGFARGGNGVLGGGGGAGLGGGIFIYDGSVELRDMELVGNAAQGGLGTPLDGRFSSSNPLMRIPFSGGGGGMVGSGVIGAAAVSASELGGGGGSGWRIGFIIPVDSARGSGPEGGAAGASFSGNTPGEPGGAGAFLSGGGGGGRMVPPGDSEITPFFGFGGAGGFGGGGGGSADLFVTGMPGAAPGDGGDGGFGGGGGAGGTQDIVGGGEGGLYFLA